MNHLEIDHSFVPVEIVLIYYVKTMAIVYGILSHHGHNHVCNRDAKCLETYYKVPHLRTRDDGREGRT